ncbi:hypothetical protein SAZ10_04840 [Mesorhizobium sp. BAC0120]|uniref:hypothetical protein n=1 Tax=Mesorhizobium sp. BAC0120 TaxID=3090670 RepID=UPI00298D09C0|nr:hypothetical protein [Mesorhizobium sp. BAC0120]MDW6021086.1 hypothetical protein [Mesorhizobium sp. BAC0120]
MAVRRFPELELTIRRMFEADQGFREMCEELVEAETALSRVEQLPEPKRAARKAEWQDLVARLTREIEVALRENQAFAQSRIDNPPRP